MSQPWVYRISVNELLLVASAGFDIPIGAKLLTVREQSSRYAALWFEVDPNAPLERRTFELIGTGFDVSPGYVYRGTCQYNDGALVLHVYETTR